jgi:hypothetical protein
MDERDAPFTAAVDMKTSRERRLLENRLRPALA